MNNDKISISGQKTTTKSSLKRQSKDPKTSNPSFNLASNHSMNMNNIAKNPILANSKKFSSSKKIQQPNSLDFPLPQFPINNNINNNNNYPSLQNNYSNNNTNNINNNVNNNINDRLYLKNIEEPTKVTYKDNYAHSVSNILNTNKSHNIPSMKYHIDNERTFNNNKSSNSNSRVFDTKLQSGSKYKASSKSPINKLKTETSLYNAYNVGQEDKKHQKTHSLYALNDNQRQKREMIMYKDMKERYNNYNNNIYGNNYADKRKSSDLALSSNSTSMNFNNMNAINNSALLTQHMNMNMNNMQSNNNNSMNMRDHNMNNSEKTGNWNISNNDNNFSYVDVNPQNVSQDNNKSNNTNNNNKNNNIVMIDDRKFSILDVPGYQVPYTTQIKNEYEKEKERKEKKSKRSIIKEQIKNSNIKSNVIKALFIMVTNK